MSPILVTLTSRHDSDFESSIVSLKESKPDGVNPNSSDMDYYVRKNEGKILWFSADCVDRLLSQGYMVLRLEKSLKKFYGKYQDLIEKYKRPVKEMVNDSFPG